ncbi:hypothetical protein J31TS4_19290 [Paenibacillus sp. J31TS4]|uniref:P27 family phage terminase small subunit n=1 Tax=Paenibacillus sp. J31TS4 TaxID=2807195 RepID=UPI001B15AA3D|nr:P27 family phage terminase small subunit [Paenibacillus sp. J31TS4]GIP38649.1 hypothetical protein J31TS4_19290 [Paenibacillus sp. J31TS4]
MFKPKSAITVKAAKELFDILVEELRIDDNLSARSIMLVDNIVLLEQLKQRAIADIKKRGAVELFKNGSQEMFRDNKSVDKVIKIVEQQRKLQAELKLTPASDRKVSGVVDPPPEGGGDDFERF